ncbi:J-domain protein required for chloroplast accumulation response 1, AUXILIN-LIKE6 [Hibiscus trionum]|uniref:J-domain protein required for chloroplast accumulation response 1, AUXILIN-LIKE6 n=1 Tax=Hibiscus trionum TaxID=183268 RepID=A0A9W7JL32_HIBTR|nr:J-domain protein required for chloroplast accumulation response 1, AUXILIN-LIKE6 [Hibiscus trionum]
MHRFSHRESILLGYSPPKTAVTDSDIDFNDVFGGPPRRTSVQETPHRFSEDMASYSSFGFRSSGETRLSGLSEKPVFGDEGMNRRRHSRTDFYDDIFGGKNRSSSCSPRKYETKDPFALSSQVRLPLTAEPLGTSLPTRFSLMKKGADLPTFDSPTRSTSRTKDASSNGSSHYVSSPLSSFSGQANQVQQEPKNDFQSSYQELSTGSEAEDSINLTEQDETGTKNGGRFHFSIYKWQCKGGVPLAIRGNGKLEQKDKLQRCSSAKGWIACESIEMESKAELDNSFLSNDRMSANAKSFRVERDDNGSLSSRFDSRNGDGERVRSTKEENIPKSESEINPSLSQIDLCDKKENETKKPQPKTLKLLLHDERGNGEMTRNDGTKDISEKSEKKLYEILDDENVKKPDTTERATFNYVEARKTRVKGSPRNSRDNGKGRVGGKVNDFIKIFNQDASPKPKPDTVHENHSSRRPERHKIKPENEPCDRMTEREVKIQMQDIQEKKSSPKVPIVNHMFNGTAEKNTNISVTDPVSTGFNTIIEDPTDSVNDNFTIEDLTPEEKILPDLGIDPEEIKAIDAKILKWSNGKEGNIRSLLSTLQYVLWPNSGWKPVPLVDIIEGPAVKRSYQKALLCLHPDKLQQKGGPSDIKYIAERVFDVLQEAWTHFNSVGWG